MGSRTVQRSFFHLTRLGGCSMVCACEKQSDDRSARSATLEKLNGAVIPQSRGTKTGEWFLKSLLLLTLTQTGGHFKKQFGSEFRRQTGDMVTIRLDAGAGFERRCRIRSVAFERSDLFVRISIGTYCCRRNWPGVSHAIRFYFAATIVRIAPGWA